MVTRKSRYALWTQAATPDAPHFFVHCSECEVIVFQWNSTNSFDLQTLTNATGEHTLTWHTDKPA